MADEFRRLLDKRTGKGGVKCYCCNWTKDSKRNSRKRSKTLLSKMVRRMLKRGLRKKIDGQNF